MLIDTIADSDNNNSTTAASAAPIRPPLMAATAEVTDADGRRCPLRVTGAAVALDLRKRERERESEVRNGKSKYVSSLTLCVSWTLAAAAVYSDSKGLKTAASATARVY